MQATDFNLFETFGRHINKSGARLAKLMGAPVIERAAGNYLYSTSGERFLSCGGFGVFTLGHQFPDLVEPVCRQLETMALVGPTIMHAGQARAAEALAAVCPDGLDHVFFVNSGAEATELALKLARLNGKRRVVATVGGYHGKTLGALSVTGKAELRSPFEPLLPNVTFVPYGDADAIRTVLRPDSCLILEPVQGEGGVKIPPTGYLTAAAGACADIGALLIIDEIQTGLGRLGTMWGFESEVIRPDILLTGKALGGGVIPVSAVVATSAAYAQLDRDPMLHTSTHAGNPLASAAAEHTVRAVVQHRVPERAAQLGAQLLPKLAAAFAATCPHLIREVRGRGLLFGIEFIEASHAAELMIEFLDRNVIVSTTLNHHGTVRLTPPAFLNDDDVDWLESAATESGGQLARLHPVSEYTVRETTL